MRNETEKEVARFLTQFGVQSVARRGLKFEQISVATISWKEVAFADSIRSATRGEV